MKRILILLLIVAAIITGCSRNETEEPVKEPEDTTDSQSDDSSTEKQEESEMSRELTMYINGTEVEVIWEDNDSVKALREMAGEGEITVSMSMYGGFEQVGSLGRSIVRNDRQTTTSYGDIVLYSGNQIVIFYGSNSWSYTRLGKVKDATEDKMRKLLANGDVTIRLVME